MKRIFKYGTGHVVPEGAIYMYSCVEQMSDGVQHLRFVWHYFLVEVKE